MRRGAPTILFGVLFSLLLGSYVVYTQSVAFLLRRDASRFGRMYARVFQALADTSQDAGNAALLDLSEHIRELGVPVIVTDAKGRPAAVANLPFRAELDDPRVARYVAELERENAPVVEPGVGMVHYGDSQLVRSLRFIPVLQSTLLAALLTAAIYVLRTRSRADRERLWAGMARESA